MSDQILTINQDSDQILIINQNTSPMLITVNESPQILTVFRGERGDPGVGANEFITRFSYGDSTPKLLNIPITGLVDRVVIGIDIPFNTPSTLSIGTSSNPSLLMSVGQNLPTEIGQFESNPSANLVNQQIILTITNPDPGISQGSGFVIVEYSVP